MSKRTIIAVAILTSLLNRKNLQPYYSSAHFHGPLLSPQTLTLVFWAYVLLMQWPLLKELLLGVLLTVIHLSSKTRVVVRHRGLIPSSEFWINGWGERKRGGDGGREQQNLTNAFLSIMSNMFTELHNYLKKAAPESLITILHRAEHFFIIPFWIDCVHQTVKI